MRRSLLLRIIVVVVLAVTAREASAASLSGSYYGLLLAVQGDEVSGAYATSRGIGVVSGTPQFSCAFLLRGKLVNGRADVSTWTPGEDATVPGTLTLGPTGATLQLRDNQPGCFMAAGDMVRSPMSVTRDRSGQGWTEVRLVAARRAVLHVAPRDGTRTAPYLVEYDAVVVVAARPNWVQVRYLGAERPVTGWLRESDLVPRDWPVRGATPR